MVEANLSFSGVVGWHLSQISLRLQQLRQEGPPDFVDGERPGHRELIDQKLKIGDARKIAGGSLLFRGDAENIEHLLLVELRGRSLPITAARIDAVISSSRDVERFVHDVYYNILGRQADNVGLEGYARLLASGALTRSAFLEVIVSSAEAKERNRPLLIMDYPYMSSDRLSVSSSKEILINSLSITVTDN